MGQGVDEMDSGAAVTKSSEIPFTGSTQLPVVAARQVLS